MRYSILVALLAAELAIAGSATVSWNNATQNTDGSPIPTTGDDALATTTIEYSFCVNGDVDSNPLITVVPATVETHIIDDLAAGDWCFKAFHTNNGGINSDPSNIATKTILPNKPNPPDILTITANIVYDVLKIEGRFVFQPMGTVPANTQCNPNYSVTGDLNLVTTTMYAVSKDQVSWAGNQRPLVIVAECS